MDAGSADVDLAGVDELAAPDGVNEKPLNAGVAVAAAGLDASGWAAGVEAGFAKSKSGFVSALGASG